MDVSNTNIIYCLLYVVIILFDFITLGNSIRFWLHPDGSPLPVVKEDYNLRIIDRFTSTQIESIRFVLDLGTKYHILFNLCLWSFDMLNDQGYGPAYGLWNLILTNDTNTLSYINNWMVPLITAIGQHQNLLSYEVFNEPEGMSTTWGWTNCLSNNSNCAKVSVLTLQRFANRVISAIHNVFPDLYVTVGSWSYIASSNVNGNTNIWSDDALIAAGGHLNGVLDFYQSM